MAAENKPSYPRICCTWRRLDLENQNQLEEEEKISEEHWYLDLPEFKEKEPHSQRAEFFLPREDLLYGRMSFRGFNPEVEKLMMQMNSKSRAQEVEDEIMEVDVPDEDMAGKNENLVGTMVKLTKKRD